MPTADVNGTTIYYEVDGLGPPVLVLNGAGFDSVLYRATLAPLAHHRSLVTFDHRGTGRSGRPDMQSLTVEQLADDAQALAQELELGPTTVLGHSFGGFVAQELALRHPGRVRNLVLVGTSPGLPGADEPAGAQDPPLPPELADLLSTPAADDRAAATKVEAIVRYYLHRVDPAHLAPLLATTTYAAAATNRLLSLRSGWSAVDRLGQVAAPALVVVGRHDVLTPPAQAERLASHLLGAELKVLESSGHLPWVDEPDRFAHLVGDWLDQHLAPSPA